MCLILGAFTDPAAERLRFGLCELAEFGFRWRHQLIGIAGEDAIENEALFRFARHDVSVLDRCGTIIQP
jgi:hypothetical protein